jgi:hypothetical protein
MLVQQSSGYARSAGLPHRGKNVPWLVEDRSVGKKKQAVAIPQLGTGINERVNAFTAGRDREHAEAVEARALSMDRL